MLYYLIIQFLVNVFLFLIWNKNGIANVVVSMTLLILSIINAIILYNMIDFKTLLGV